MSLHGISSNMCMLLARGKVHRDAFNSTALGTNMQEEGIRRMWHHVPQYRGERKCPCSQAGD